jgi:hypothetical protein
VCDWYGIPGEKLKVKYCIVRYRRSPAGWITGKFRASERDIIFLGSNNLGHNGGGNSPPPPPLFSYIPQEN